MITTPPIVIDLVILSPQTNGFIAPAMSMTSDSSLQVRTFLKGVGIFTQNFPSCRPKGHRVRGRTRSGSRPSRRSSRPSRHVPRPSWHSSGRSRHSSSSDHHCDGGHKWQIRCHIRYVRRIGISELVFKDMTGLLDLVLRAVGGY